MANLKLVLLPGLDGTGALFSDFIASFDGTYQIIPLPPGGSQDYQSLSIHIANQLPKEDFILLAESFSGGLVPKLIGMAPERIKGVIFVASFLSPPNIILLRLAQALPLTTLLRLRAVRFLIQRACLRKNASHVLVQTFMEVISHLPAKLIKRRIKTITDLKPPNFTVNIPSAYLQANNDLLVSRSATEIILKVFPDIKFYKIDGPHFILQTKPEESAMIVAKFISEISEPSPRKTNDN